MSIYFGNDTVNDLYVGLTPVSKGYVGTHLFYDGDNTIIDTTYEKYILNTQFSTLYNTAEKPVKSAILKGQTLKNLCPQKTAECSGNKWVFTTVVLDPNLFKANSAYYFDVKCSNTNNAVVNIEKIWFVVLRNNAATTIAKTNNSMKFTMPSNYNTSTDTFQIRVHCSAGNSATNTITCDNMMIFDYYDGIELKTFPYVEYGTLQSVKMPVLTTSNEDGTKSNILTVNEDVELRGVDDVQDTLNLMTGEFTERIGEVVLDGSEGWIIGTTKENTQIFSLSLNNSKIGIFKKNSKVLCDKLKTISGVDEECVILTSSLYIGLLKSKASTIDELKVYLSQNPITVQCQRTKESVKIVDLSVVNQDGNSTKLNTFNDITYVTLSSEGLIPEAELEVATKNEEVLNTMSLEMDDISTTQNALQETSNTQSENVDATMMATTEIYEQLL